MTTTTPATAPSPSTPGAAPARPALADLLAGGHRPHLLVRGGRLFDPASGLDRVGDLFISEGKICGLSGGAPAGFPAAGSELLTVIDAHGLLVCPGLIDIHCHLREPGREDKETIGSGTRAAAAGGFTTVCPIPNTSPVIDSSTTLAFIQARATAEGYARVLPYASVTRGQAGQDIVEFGDLAANGARGFTDDGRPVMNNEIMRRALEYSAMLGLPVLDHCEDAHLAEGGCMHEGDVSARLGLRGIPGAAESLHVARDADLAELTGGHIHIMHVSKRQSLVHVRSAKQRGVRLTCEVTPHHLTLTDEELLEFNTLAKVNPPLGDALDREAMIEALLDGTIDCIATDHAPHTDIEKDGPITDAPFGMIGLETAFALLYTELVLPERVPLTMIIEKMTAAPARVLGLGAEAGRLAVGAAADVALLDLDAEWEVGARTFHSKSRNTPLLGRRLRGDCAATICAGRLVFAGGALHAAPPFAPTQARY